MTTIDDNICYMFNQIYLNLMKEVKDKNGEIKHALKESYKVFDKKSGEYLQAFVQQFNETVTGAVFAPDEDDKVEADILAKEAVRDFSVFKKVTVCDILEKVVKDDAESRASLTYYVYLLFVLGYIHQLTELDDGKKEIVFHKTVELIGSVEKDDLGEEELEKHLEEILDEDLQNVLRKIHRERSKVKDSVINIDMTETGGGGGPAGRPGMEFLENTKIGELAKEISESIDMSKLMEGGGGEMPSGPEGMNPDMLSTIIQTVGSKITEKMTSGELNQEDLMSEAISMMGKMNTSGHGDMMSNMMNMMGGMMGPGGGMPAGFGPGGGGFATSPAGGGSTGNRTKDRLKKKLEMKKANANGV